MSNAQQNQNDPNLLLNTVLIILETVFSLVVKHDRVIALRAKKFIEQKVSVKINSYIPFFDIYIQFTEQGILFDSNAPTEKIDLEVRTTLIDLLKIILLGNTRSIKAMRIEGDSVLGEEFKDLLSLFSIVKILADWKQWLNDAPDDANLTTSNKRIRPLLDKIDQQRAEINTLKVDVKRYQNRIRRIERRQKYINFALSSIIVLFVLIFVYNLWV